MCSEWEIEELGCRACGKTDKETEQLINDSKSIELIEDKYGIDFEVYCEIVKDLLPFTPQIKAAISGELYHAFVDVKESRAIVKTEATNKPVK